VSRVYDGTTSAVLGTSNLQLAGLVSGQSISLTSATGSYASPNAGSGIVVSASFAPGNFTAGTGTLLGNYLLPTSASAAIGTITPRLLTATLTGSVSRVYDGTTSAVLGTSNLQLAGLVSGQSISLTSATGSYASPNAGTGIVVSASFAAGDFAAGAGTLLANYLLPTTASAAIGTITPRPLTASLTGSVSRVYDGTTSALLGTDNLQLAGLLNGQSISLTSATGSYATPNAGTGIVVSASFAPSHFAAGAGTLLANYLLPVQASGLVGTITQRPLTATLGGRVERPYDGTMRATLLPSNFQVAGLVSGEDITIRQSEGMFASPNTGTGIVVNASFTPSSFAAGVGTILANYLLPTSASAAIGTITRLSLTYVANPALRFAGDVNPVFTGSLTGFLAGESLETATSGQLRFESPAQPESPPGLYPILGTGLAATNYVFAQAPGNATALTVSINVINTVNGTVSAATNAAVNATVPVAASGPTASSTVAGQLGGAMASAPALSSAISPATTGMPPLESSPVTNAVAPMTSFEIAASPRLVSAPPSPVEPTPPSPLPSEPEPIGADADDVDDPVLQSASTGPRQRAAGRQERAQGTALIPEVELAAAPAQPTPIDTLRLSILVTPSP
jgi:uncharacterized protein YigA (DUF484 family)